MPIDRVPIEDQPEFDDIGPITAFDKFLMLFIWPIAWINGMVKMPFTVRAGPPRPVTHRYEPLAAEDRAAMPPVVRSFLERSESDASRLGFIDPVWQIGPDRRETGPYMLLMPSADGEDLCICYGSHTPRRLTVKAIVFHTRMSDGLSIVTGNEGGTGSAPRPNHDVVTFADITDLPKLHRIHRRRTKHLRTGDRVPVRIGWHPPAMHPTPLLDQHMREAIEWAVEQGRLEPPTDDGMRPTMKGAALTAWGIQWPLRQINAWKERRLADRVLRELGSE